MPQIATTPRPAPEPAAPLVRLVRLKEDVSALGALGPGVRTRVLARIGPEALAEIERGAGVGWVPVSLKARIADAVFAEAGAAGARAWGKASFLASLDSFFKPFILGVASLFGLTPATLLKIAPQSWKTVYRNAGELAVRAQGDGRATIVARDLPPMLRTNGYLHLLAGTFEAGIEVLKLSGEVKWEQGGERPGDVTYSVTWRSR